MRIIFKHIYVTLTSTTIMVVGMGVMVTGEYSTFPRSPELEQHQQTQFNVWIFLPNTSYPTNRPMKGSFTPALHQTHIH